MEEVNLFLIPGVTAVLAWGLIWAFGKVPKVLMVPVILPGLGFVANWLLVQAGAESASPALILFLGASAAALERAMRHLSGAAKAVWNKGSGGIRLPMTTAARHK